jgi:hypothetical protein
LINVFESVTSVFLLPWVVLLAPASWLEIPVSGQEKTQSLKGQFKSVVRLENNLTAHAQLSVALDPHQKSP